MAFTDKIPKKSEEMKILTGTKMNAFISQSLDKAPRGTDRQTPDEDYISVIAKIRNIANESAERGITVNSILTAIQNTDGLTRAKRDNIEDYLLGKFVSTAHATDAQSSMASRVNSPSTSTSIPF